MPVSGFTVSSSPMVYATFRLVTRVFKEKHSRFSVYHRLKTMRLMPLSHNNNNNSNTRDWIDRNSPMPTYRLIKILSRSISPKSSQTRNTHATHTLNIYIYTYPHTFTHTRIEIRMHIHVAWRACTVHVPAFGYTPARAIPRCQKPMNEEETKQTRTVRTCFAPKVYLPRDDIFTYLETLIARARLTGVNSFLASPS